MQVNRDYLRAKGGFPYRGPLVGDGIEIRDAALNLRTGHDLDRNIFSALRQAGRNVSGHARSGYWWLLVATGGYWLMARTLTAQESSRSNRNSLMLFPASRVSRFLVFFETSMLAVFKKSAIRNKRHDAKPLVYTDFLCPPRWDNAYLQILANEGHLGYRRAVQIERFYSLLHGYIGSILGGSAYFA